MIRYIHIGAQIKAGNNDFALFDDDVGEFFTICGTRIFRSLAHLEDRLLTDGMHPVVVRLTLDMCRDHDRHPLSPCQGDPLPADCTGRDKRTDPMVGDWFASEDAWYEVAGVGDTVFVQVHLRSADKIITFMAPLSRTFYANGYTKDVTILTRTPPSCPSHPDNLCLTPDDIPVVEGVCA